MEINHLSDQGCQAGVHTVDMYSYLLETVCRKVEVEAHPRQRQHQFVDRSVRVVVLVDLFVEASS